MKVLIKYNFIFDPSDVWINQAAFDADLGAFFKQRGLKAEVVESVDKECKTVYIGKDDSAGLATATPMEQPSKSVKQIKADLSQKRGFDGKFEKRNG